jgi:hypothetical protein
MSEAPPHEADSLLRIVNGMRDEELRVLAERTRHRNTAGATTLRVILLGTVLTFLLAGVALQPMRAGVAARLTESFSGGEETAVAGDAMVDGPRAAAEVRLQALQRAVATIAAARDPAGGARALVDAGIGAFAAVLSAVVVPNGAGGFSVLHASPSALDSVSPDLAHRVAEILRTGAPMVATSRAERERECGTLDGLDLLGARGAALFVPLRRDGIVNGVMLVAFEGDHEFSEDEMSFATTLGLLGGPAVASGPQTH